MRSVSIVYHKGRDDQLLSRLTHTNSLVKRSVDQYYTKLLEKEKYKEKEQVQTQQQYVRNKIKTSKNYRNSLQYNIVGLNIAQMSIRQPPEDKRIEEKNRQKALILRKLDTGKTVLKGLNLPHNIDSFDEEEQQEKNMHCKIKNLYRGKLSEDAKETIIVISANFVVDEHSFWQETQIQQQSVRFWKVLQSHAIVIWLCEKEQSCKKLIRYSKQNKLRLDGVYLILGKKNRRNLTVSFHAIENDYGIRFHKSNSPLITKDEKKMIAIQGLTLEQGRQLQYSNLHLSIPIIKNYRSVVHYIKIDINDKGRLNSVIKVLSHQSPPKSLNILLLLQEYQRNLIASKAQEGCSCKYKEQKEPTNLLLKMQQIKSKMMRYFTQSLSLNLNDRIFYDQSENSIQFIIGDILRRNYKIFQNYYQYSDEYRQFKQHQKVHNKQDNKSKNMTKRYRNKAYFWEF